MHLYKIIQRALNPVLFTSIAPSSTIFVQLSEPGYWHRYSGDRTFPSLTKPLSGHTHSPPTITSPLVPNNHSSVLHFHNFVISSEVAQSCPTLCDPLDYIYIYIAHEAPPSIEFSRQEYWSGVAMSSSRGSSWPRDRTQVSHIAGRRFTLWATREAQDSWNSFKFLSFQECHINGMIQYNTVWDWLFSLSVTLWTFIQVVAHSKSLSLFITE